MRYYSAQSDKNQPEIVAALRKMGAYVLPIHRLKNCCDLVVLYRGRVVMVEVKSRASAKLTEGEEDFSEDWIANGGKYAVLTSTDEAVAMIDGMRHIT